MKPLENELDWDAPDLSDEDVAFPANDDFTFGSGDLEGDLGEEVTLDSLDSFETLNEAPLPNFDDAYASPAPAQTFSFMPGGPMGDQPIPRIRIRASFDRPEIANLLQQVATDRRLAKTEFEMEPGGIDAATAYCAANSSPNLIILDTLATPTELLTKLDRLAEHVEEGSKVVIIGAANDIGLFRELMSRGVSEYLVPPLQPLQIIRAISALYVNPDKPFAGKVVSVVGAKGGVGASTIAHNLAWLIAERFQANTTMVDLDLSFGTGALDFNQEPQQTVAEALLSPDRVDEVFLDRLLMRQTERLMLFCAPATLDREFEIDPEAFETVIDRVRRSAPFVVLDLPHIWTPWMRQTLLSSDEVIVIATPELASLRNAKNMIDRVKSARPHDQPPIVVLNMTGVAKRPEIPVKDFSEALGIEPSLVIPFDPQVFGMAANNGQMLGELAAAAKIAGTLEELAARLCGRQVVVKKKSSIGERLPFLKR
jgi:pilus assembly protein CpaE